MLRDDERCDECAARKIWFTAERLCRDCGLAVGADWLLPEPEPTPTDDADEAKEALP